MTLNIRDLFRSFFLHVRIKQRRIPIRIFFSHSLKHTLFWNFNSKFFLLIHNNPECVCNLCSNGNAENSEIVRFVCEFFSFWAQLPRPQKIDEKRKTRTRQSHWATTDNDEGYDFVHEKPRKQKKYECVVCVWLKYVRKDRDRRR